jgi:glutathione S-transferase
MGQTAHGGLPRWLRLAWPALVTRVAFVKRLVDMADNGMPVREAKLKLYADFIARLEGGPFLAGRDVPAMPDLAAYPQFALYYMTGFHAADHILEAPELMAWLERMRPYVDGTPPLVPAVVRKRELP